MKSFWKRIKIGYLVYVALLLKLAIMLEAKSYSSLQYSEDGDVTEVTDESIVYFETTTLFSDIYTNTEVIEEETTTQLVPEDLVLGSIQDTHFKDCGIPKVKKGLHGVTRVIGGQPVSEGEFPWFAAITKYQHHKQPRWRVICGAALINDEFAITAAHCLHKRFKDTLQLSFNVRDTNEITKDPEVINRRIKEVFIHPSYDPDTQHNDIALIQFKIPIDFESEARAVPICLPPTRGSGSSRRRNGTFAGFGHTSYGTTYPGPNENSRVLMKISVPILTHAECLRTKVPSKKNVTESMVCAGSQGKDACINDSGGPLMVQERGRTTLVGLSSWGIGCALPDYPGIYTRVSHYLNWIKKTASLE